MQWPTATEAKESDAESRPVCLTSRKSLTRLPVPPILTPILRYSVKVSVASTDLRKNQTQSSAQTSLPQPLPGIRSTRPIRTTAVPSEDEETDGRMETERTESSANRDETIDDVLAELMNAEAVATRPQPVWRGRPQHATWPSTEMIAWVRPIGHRSTGPGRGRWTDEPTPTPRISWATVDTVRYIPSREDEDSQPAAEIRSAASPPPPPPPPPRTTTTTTTTRGARLRRLQLLHCCCCFRLRRERHHR